MRRAVPLLFAFFCATIASAQVTRSSPGASRVRACLTDLTIPASATLRVYGIERIPIGFGATLAHDGVLWTPSVAGSTITIEADANVHFTVATIAEVPAIEDTSCLADVACVSDEVVQRVSSAIGRYSFISDREVIVCTGALIADRSESFTPYFLTAYHCVMNAAEAATVEVFWDDRARSCGGEAPPLDSLPRTNGALLVASGVESDVALLLLSSVPGPRTFLGWTTEPVREGMLLNRISNPGGQKQHYSVTSVDERSTSCAVFPRPRFIHSLPLSGSTSAGSSGAPAWIGNGIIVGQLATHCAALPNAEPCLPGNKSIDGAFAASYEVLKPFLDPPRPKRRAVRR